MQCNSPHYLEYQNLETLWDEIEATIINIMRVLDYDSEKVNQLWIELEDIWERQVEISNSFWEQ